MSESNIIPFYPESDLAINLAPKDPASPLACSGIHHPIQVDLVNREIRCQTCGRIVDAFDYVAEWAREGDRRMGALKRIRAETRIASDELKALTNKLRNTRQQLKKAGTPQTEDERLFFDRQRWNPET